MKRTAKTVFLLITMIAFFSGCKVMNPPAWVVYHADEDGMYLYDQANIEKDEKRHLLKIWDGALFNDAFRKNKIQPKTRDGSLPADLAALSIVRNLEIIDCANKKYKISIVVLYDSSGKILLSGYDEDDPEWKDILWLMFRAKDGSVLRTPYKTDASGWRKIVPDSHGDLLCKAVCKS
ncbi:MAG TPA: hypothetical protein PK927_03490 [Smithellaceae bacterium]|nr:hypothetical protein [Smithellaceae bacterium]